MSGSVRRRNFTWDDDRQERSSFLPCLGDGPADEVGSVTVD
jgi:hypothetical protein